jgi:hypothetical protein
MRTRAPWTGKTTLISPGPRTCRRLAATGIATRTKVAYQWWTEQDRPDRQQFHLTVTRERQWVWLDDPADTVTSLA